MKIAAALIGLLIFATAECNPAEDGRSDKLWEPLSAFVASVDPDHTHALAFHTSWGSNFNDKAEPAIFAKQCLHHGYAPAKAACEALMEHGVVEFSNTNAERAVTCLSPDTRFGKHVAVERGSLSLRYVTENRGSHVTIEYHDDPEKGGMVLLVTVDG